jgi:toxin-antitoxin system PIN domain toxin
MRLVDANVLLYAINEDAREHGTARRWLETSLNGQETVAFAWVALLAFVRVSTRSGIFARPLDAETACGFVDEWLAQPVSVVLAPTPRHLSILRGLLHEAGTAGNLTSDAHLAALAIEHGAEIWSFDRDFDRFPGLTAHVPA